jgi:hypothetical protein
MISRRLRSVALGLTSFLVLCSLLWAQPGNPPASCSNMTLHDTYGYMISGTRNGTPIAVVGLFATDGNGTLSGMETESQNGVVMQPSTLGLYAIQSDCTGTLEIDPAGETKEHFNVAVTSGGAEIEMVETDAGATMVGTAQARLMQSCSTAGVQGSYGLQGAGTEIGIGPVVIAGQINLHGDGTMDGSATISLNGSIVSGETISGAYKIDNRCFGGSVMFLNHQRPMHLNLVVIKREQRILFIQTDANSLLSGSWQQ